MQHVELLRWEREWLTRRRNVEERKVKFNAFLHFFSFLFPNRGADGCSRALFPVEQPWLNALHKTVISESSPTQRARLFNVNERQRTKLFLKLAIKLVHSRPSLKGMSVLLPLTEVIILFLSENNKWSLTMGCIFWSWNLSLARRRGFNFLASTGHFFFSFFPLFLALCLSRGIAAGAVFVPVKPLRVYLCALH